MSETARDRVSMSKSSILHSTRCPMLTCYGAEWAGGQKESLPISGEAIGCSGRPRAQVSVTAIRPSCPSSSSMKSKFLCPSTDARIGSCLIVMPDEGRENAERREIAA